MKRTRMFGRCFLSNNIVRGCQHGNEFVGFTVNMTSKRKLSPILPRPPNSLALSSSTVLRKQQFMGGADLIPFLGSTFNDWFPVVILIPAAMMLFNIHGRLLRLCGLRDFLESDRETSVVLHEEDAEAFGGGRIVLNAEIAEGKLLVEEERAAEERRINPNQGQRDNGILNRSRTASDAYTAKHNRNRQQSRPSAGEPSSGGSSTPPRQNILDTENSSGSDPSTSRLREELLSSRTRVNRESLAPSPPSSPTTSTRARTSGLSREELLANRKGRTTDVERRDDDDDDDDDASSVESSFLRLTNRAKKGFGGFLKVTKGRGSEGGGIEEEREGLVPQGKQITTGAIGGEPIKRGPQRSATPDDPIIVAPVPRQPISSILTDLTPTEGELDEFRLRVSSADAATTTSAATSQHNEHLSSRTRTPSPNPFASFRRTGASRVSPFTRFESSSSSALATPSNSTANFAGRSSSNQPPSIFEDM